MFSDLQPVNIPEIFIARFWGLLEFISSKTFHFLLFFFFYKSMAFLANKVLANQYFVYPIFLLIQYFRNTWNKKVKKPSASYRNFLFLFIECLFICLQTSKTCCWWTIRKQSSHYINWKLELVSSIRGQSENFVANFSFFWFFESFLRERFLHKKKYLLLHCFNLTF